MSFRVQRIVGRRLQLPLRSAFEHAASSRDRTDNLICEVTLDDGTTGWGEGVPRAHVTGEDVADSIAALKSLDLAGLSAPVDQLSAALPMIRQLVESIPDQTPMIRNACRSAIEIALLDAFGRAFGVSLGRWLSSGRAGAGPEMAYSLVVGRALAGDEAGLAALRDRFGYRAVKMKVGFGLAADLKNLARVRRVFGGEVAIRVDANRAWRLEEAVEFLARARGLGITAVEDPVAGATIDEMLGPLRTLREEHGAEVILDEPLRTLGEVERAVTGAAVDVVSVRVSKCGGLLRSLEIASRCRGAGTAVQLGCQVGESAILSAAGRHFAFASGGLRYLEGSNESLKFLPEQYVCAEDLTYGQGAMATPLEGAGLGISVDRERIAKLSEVVFDRRS